MWNYALLLECFAGDRKTMSVRMPETRQQNESIKSAAVMLWVVSRIFPTRYGLTYPARFPTELIQAMPAEAAVPESSVVGKAQKVE